ncbi:MAG: hypothetical protein GWM98_16210, partial [Nitrospinaceae bacterium]|nr:hypothetical protein [Nitrospinaceae bacterium]NIU45238.1 hypothetical protein [Nitrospinaceae bacterium]NIY16326.1 hypothetical protein [Nitrospinaceae bacterium]
METWETASCSGFPGGVFGEVFLLSEVAASAAFGFGAFLERDIEIFEGPSDAFTSSDLLWEISTMDTWDAFSGSGGGGVLWGAAGT